jgi:DNA polymerase I-like protein with 3'-5' exonuclease and polymerase domains
MLLTIHDSIDWQFEDSEHGRVINAEAIRIFQNEHESLIKLRVPMPVESEIGRNWAEATFGVKDD